MTTSYEESHRILDPYGYLAGIAVQLKDSLDRYDSTAMNLPGLFDGSGCPTLPEYRQALADWDAGVANLRAAAADMRALAERHRHRFS
jgi:hypothetical protein